jgi:uncharacterized delta-60 repeat protein
MVLQPDLKLVVAGMLWADFFNRLVIVRYMPDGSLDLSFGAGGQIEAKPIANCTLVLQPDGKLVAAGSLNVSGRSVFALTRFLPDGRIDSAFGTDGMLTTDFGKAAMVSAIALQSDRKIVAAGVVTTGKETDGLRPEGRFALARYLPDGNPDRGFGLNGIIVSDFGVSGRLMGNYSGAGAHALGILPNGDMVVAGSVESGDRVSFGMSRYLPSGALDKTFGMSGLVITHFGAGAPSR